MTHFSDIAQESKNEELACLQLVADRLQAENERLRLYKQAAHYHNLVLIVESNGRCSLHNSSSFMLQMQDEVYRAIFEQIDTETELKKAVKLLAQGKKQFAPMTTNSLVDDFLKKHEELLK